VGGGAGASAIARFASADSRPLVATPRERSVIDRSVIESAGAFSEGFAATTDGVDARRAPGLGAIWKGFDSLGVEAVGTFRVDERTSTRPA
jgi:hypothetical protein